MEKYVIFHTIEEKIWYITDIRYYERPEIDWILYWGSGLDIKDAMVFHSKIKAQKIAAIMRDQKDDHGKFDEMHVKELEHVAS